MAAEVVSVAESIIKGSGWKLAGTSEAIAENVTYPADAMELYIVGRADDVYPTYTGYVDVSIALGNMSFVIGGYSTSASDMGSAVVSINVTNRTVHFVEIKYGNRNAGKFYVYYR